jgi:chromosome segregation protein
MRIAKIEMSGFKSFRDRTTLTLDGGINGVVGPNGCGKSNVIDAVRWALGEQRVKALRGGNMTDVIFAGSATSPAADTAEVKLAFVTEGDETLPSPYNRAREVVVSRRLHRSGDSEYLINGEKVRLKDVQALFLGTGAGLSSYSIIEQGAVGFIVTARPSERRDLIEEAAGISRYRSQRATAERNLQLTEQNFGRVDDLLGEVSRQVASLRQQAARAERYEVMTTEERRLGLRAWFHDRSQLQQQINASRLRAQESAIERQALDDSSAAEREALAILRYEREQLHKRFEAVVEQCLRVEAKQQLLTGNIDHGERDVIAAQDTLTENTKRMEQLEVRAQEAVTSRQRMDEQVAELEDIRPQQQQLVVLKQRLDAERSALHTASHQLAAARSRRHQSEQQLDRAQERLRGLQESRARLEERYLRAAEEIHAIEDDRAWAAQHMEEARLSALTAAEGFQVITHRQQAAAAEVARATQLTAERRAAERRASDAVIRLEATLKALEGVDKPADKGDKKAPSAASPAATARLIPLASMLDVPKAEERRLSAALDADLDALWVDPLSPVESLAALLRGESAPGRAPGRLLLLDAPADAAALAPLPLGVSVLRPPGVDDPSVAEAHRQRLHRWLSDRLNAVTFLDDEALLRRHQAADRPPLCERWVSDSGASLGCDGALRRPGHSSSNAMLERARQVRDTRAQLAQAREAADGAAAEIEQTRALEVQLRKTLSELDAALAEARDDHHEARAAVREAELRLQTQTERHTRCQRILDDIDEERDRLDADQQTTTQRQNSLRDELRTLQQDASDAETRHLDLQRAVQDLERDAHQAQMVMARLEAQRTARLEAQAQARRLEASVTEQLRHLHTEQTTLFHRIEERREQLTHDRVELHRTHEDAARARAARLEVEQNLQGQEAKLSEAESKLQAYEVRARALDTSLQDARVEHSRAEATVEVIDRQHSERYSISLTDAVAALGDALREPWQEEWRAQLDDLRQKLRRFGEVNTGAIKEYEEAQKREADLKAQRDDLQKAVDDLKEAIQRIDNTCRSRFKKTFDAVNASFQQIFPKLFSGGKAQLVLTDPDDLLTTGVDIVAQPPGKKLQILSLLSGGEKAMTAVALMTALFLLRPAPFCILDEVDAPLDDVNVTRFTRLLTELSQQTQVLVVTHNRLTMRVAQRLYGATMQRDGVSQLLSIKLDEFGPPPPILGASLAPAQRMLPESSVAAAE